MKRLFIYILVCFAINLVVWHIIVTEELIENSVNKALVNYGYTLDIQYLRKDLLFNLYAEQVSLKPAEEIQESYSEYSDVIVSGSYSIPEISIYNLEVKPKLLPPSIHFKFDIFGGEASGFATITKDFTVNLYDISVYQISEYFDFSGDGVLNGKITSDECRFSVNNASFEPLYYGGIYVPLDMFSSINGTFKFGMDFISIDLISMEGDTDSAQITGKMTREEIDLIVDFMPQDDQKWQEILTPFRINYGHYKIPIKTALTE